MSVSDTGNSGESPGVTGQDLDQTGRGLNPTHQDSSISNHCSNAKDQGSGAIDRSVGHSKDHQTNLKKPGQKNTVVIGAGAGGLAAAIELALAGFSVTVLEAHEQPGGKMRQLAVPGASATDTTTQGIDAGPTVFTMDWVFRNLFERAGQCFEEQLPAECANVLARHGWTDGSRLDLHASIEASAEAIETFSDRKNADGFMAFCDRSAAIYRTLRDTFMAAQQPNPLSLSWRVGLHRLPALWQTAPHRSLWGALGDHFTDPRLQQLFGRYATYVGSSPLQCPATLMLIAHVEQSGVWLLPGGMRSLADALCRVGRNVGVDFHFSTPATAINTDAAGRVCGVHSADNYWAADAVVFAGDHAALAQGVLGEDVKRAVPPVKPKQRGLSALTWCLSGQMSKFPLHYHTVFFDKHYPQEFDAVFNQRQVPVKPTVYLCAQDRVGGNGDPESTGDERFLMLINAPADGDTATWHGDQIDDVRHRALAVMTECGAELSFDDAHCMATSPSDFHRLFPASGGSLYGRASHGMMASFQRPGARSKVRGLYLAGGTVHPGPGVPMATLSGQLAAWAVVEDVKTKG